MAVEGKVRPRQQYVRAQGEASSPQASRGGRVMNPLWTAVKEGKYERVLELFAEADKKPDGASKDDITACFAALSNLGRGRELAAHYARMKKAGIPLHPSLYSTLILCGDATLTPNVCWADMEAAGVVPTPQMVNAYVFRTIRIAQGEGRKPKLGETYVGKQLWAWLVEQRAKYPNMAAPMPGTYAMILQQCAGARNAAALASEIVAQMTADNVRLDTNAGVALLDLAISKSSPSLAARALAALQKANFEIDEGTLMALCAVWAKRGMWTNVLELEPELRRRFPECQPSEGYLRLALHSLTRTRDTEAKVAWGEVFRILHEMDARGFSRSSPLVQDRLNFLMRDAESVDRAFYMLEDMAEAGVKVAHADLLMIIRGCGRLQDLDRAFATFAEFPVFGLQPDLAAYSELLSACQNCKDPDTALHVLDQMRNAGIEPDKRARTQLINLLGTPQHVDRALEIMGGDFTFPLQAMHAVLWALAMQAQRVEDARTVLKGIRAVNPNFKLYGKLAERMGEVAPSPLQGSSDTGANQQKHQTRSRD